MNNKKNSNLKILNGLTKYIVPVTGNTKEAIEAELIYLNDIEFDIIEWRLDHFKFIQDFNKIEEVIDLFNNYMADKPVIFTFRTFKEGGILDINDEFYLNLLTYIIEHKYCDIVDIELFTAKEKLTKLINLAHTNNVLVICSNHDFENTPSSAEIYSRYEQMIKLKADIIKIAVMPNKNADIANLLTATSMIKTLYPNQSLVAISMSKLGLISRIANTLFDSEFVFCAGKNKSAPGQIDVKKLKIIQSFIENT